MVKQDRDAEVGKVAEAAGDMLVGLDGELKPSAGPLEMGCQNLAKIPGRWEKIIVATRRRGARPLASTAAPPRIEKGGDGRWAVEAPEGAQLLI